MESSRVLGFCLRELAPHSDQCLRHDARFRQLLADNHQAATLAVTPTPLVLHPGNHLNCTEGDPERDDTFRLVQSVGLWASLHPAGLETLCGPPAVLDDFRDDNENIAGARPIQESLHRCVEG